MARTWFSSEHRYFRLSRNKVSTWNSRSGSFRFRSGLGHHEDLHWKCHVNLNLKFKLFRALAGTRLLQIGKKLVFPTIVHSPIASPLYENVSLFCYTFTLITLIPNKIWTRSEQSHPSNPWILQTIQISWRNFYFQKCFFLNSLQAVKQADNLFLVHFNKSIACFYWKLITSTVSSSIVFVSFFFYFYLI